MSRLAPPTYLQQRAHLRHLWFDQTGGAMRYLSALEQWDLHGFYAPADDFTEQQALAYRAATTKEHPSLPQRAGRAYARLLVFVQWEVAERYLASLPPRRTPPVKGGKRTNHRGVDMNIRVQALVRPKIDYKNLALALLEFARSEERRKEEDAA